MPEIPPGCVKRRQIVQIAPPWPILVHRERTGDPQEQERTGTMDRTTFTQDQLLDALDFVGAEDPDITNDYSGRAMYGRTCFGVTTDQVALVPLAIVTALIEAANGDIDADDAVNEAARIVGAARTDSMGMSTIIYFPGWLLADEDDADAAPDVECWICNRTATDHVEMDHPFTTPDSRVAREAVAR